jgi:prepilin-type processing-associated H-X9-DG protein
LTYSIVARDPVDGHMGVATQSQAFSVGSSVSWAAPGHGVIATQSMGEPMYGELGLTGLSAGLTAQEALTALNSVDPHPERRQVAMVDGHGNVAAYTGSACVAAAGHVVGDGCAALGNLVDSPAVWTSMLEAFQASAGWLPRRLLDALDAAEAAGGDIRGQRSAAIRVVRSERSGRPWHDHVVDLRVDDHPQPLVELRRLVEHTWRYHRTVAAFELTLSGRPDDALAALPDEQVDPAIDPDIAWWRAVVLANAGQEAAAARLADALLADAPRFAAAARRFGAAGLMDQALLDRLLPDR